MGLALNITSVEAAQSLVMARAVGIAMGDPRSVSSAIYEMTGNARLAQRVEFNAMAQKARNG